jgi:hypothetical protein
MVLTGKPQVLFIISSPPLPGQPAPPEQHFILSEGDRQEGIEVKKIDLQNNTVTFDNHQVIQELDLAAGPSFSTAQGPATGPVAANMSGNTNRHRLVRRQNLTHDSQAPVAPDLDQAPTFDRFSGSVSLPPGALAGAISQSVDNSQKPSTTSAAPSTTRAVPSTTFAANLSTTPAANSPSIPAGYPLTQTPLHPPLSGISSGDGDYEDLTPAELAEKENAAGGDVPPPPADTGN